MTSKTIRAALAACALLAAVLAHAGPATANPGPVLSPVTGPTTGNTIVWMNDHTGQSWQLGQPCGPGGSGDTVAVKGVQFGGAGPALSFTPVPPSTQANGQWPYAYWEITAFSPAWTAAGTVPVSIQTYCDSGQPPSVAVPLQTYTIGNFTYVASASWSSLRNYPPFPTPPSECPLPSGPGFHIQNPSFECPGMPLRPDQNDWNQFPRGLIGPWPTGPSLPNYILNATSGIPGWQQNGWTLQYFRNASDGTYSISYQSYYGWIWTKLLSLEAGKLYDVAFDVLQASYSNPRVQSDVGITARLDDTGPPIFATDITTQIAAPAMSLGTATINSGDFVNPITYYPRWFTRHIYFLATRSEAILSFHKLFGAVGGGTALLDNVRITERDATLTVAKNVVVAAPLAAAPSGSQQFNINVSCTAPDTNIFAEPLYSGAHDFADYNVHHTVSFYLINGLSQQQAIPNLLQGATCTVEEDQSSIPTQPVPDSGCTSGWAQWGPAPPPQGVTMSSDQTATIVNTYACVPPTLIPVSVEKTVTVVAPAGPPPTSQAFSVNVGCTGANYSSTQPVSFTYGNGTIAAEIVPDIPLGVTCTATEQPLTGTVADSNCTSGSAQWGAPQYPDATDPAATSVDVTVANGSVLHVHNTYACVPLGELHVQKVVVNPTNADLSTWQYPVSVSCDQPAAPVVPAMPPLTANGPAGIVSGIPIGTNCSASEDVASLAVPDWGQACPAGYLAQWAAPAYSPASVTIGDTPSTITVTNALGCAPIPPHAELKVTKTVEIVAPATPPPSTTQFNITATCANTDYPIQFSLSGGLAQQQIVTGMTPGATCAVLETGLSTAPIRDPACPSGFAAWDPIGYPGAEDPNATVTSVPVAGSATLNVKNTYACVPVQTHLDIQKIVVNHTNFDTADLADWVFPVVVTCGGQPHPIINVMVNHPGVVIGDPSGATCTATEHTQQLVLPPPHQACDPGLVPYWQPAVIPPVTGPLGPYPVKIAITNTLDCVKPATIRKEVVNNTPIPATIAAGWQFPITILCGDTVVAQPVLAHNQSAVVPIPDGGECKFDEDVSQVLPGKPCPAGANPQWTISTTGDGYIHGGETFTITNTLNCVGTATLTIKKAVVDLSGGQAPPASFGFNILCGGATIHATVPGETALPVTVPSGVSCQVTESSVPAPTHIAACSGLAGWVLPPTYSPGQVFNLMPNGSALVLVTNKFACFNGPKAPVCLSGTVLKNGVCISDVVCKAPRVPGKDGKTCICSGGAELQEDGTCVAARPQTDLSLKKTAQETCEPGGNCRFEIAVTNVGSAPYTGSLVVRDEFDLKGAKFPATSGGWSCMATGGVWTCLNPSVTLAPGASSMLPLDVALPRDAGRKTEISNCGTLAYPDARDAHSDPVRFAQFWLTAAGIDVGPLDGKMGRKTHLGIEAFRATAGLPGGTDINAPLIEALIARFPVDTNPENDRACVDIQVTQTQPNPGRPSPEPGMSCLGGKLVDGICDCPDGTQQRQVRDNIIACVGTSTSKPNSIPIPIPAPTPSAKPISRIVCEGGRLLDNKCDCPDGTSLKQTGDNSFLCVKAEKPKPAEIICKGGRVQDGKCDCPKGTDLKQTGDNSFLCLAAEKPKPAEIICKGGRVQNGKCDCPKGTDLKQPGDNAFECSKLGN